MTYILKIILILIIPYFYSTSLFLKHIHNMVSLALHTKLHLYTHFDIFLGDNTSLFHLISTVRKENIAVTSLSEKKWRVRESDFLRL